MCAFHGAPDASGNTEVERKDGVCWPRSRIAPAAMWFGVESHERFMLSCESGRGVCESGRGVCESGRGVCESGRGVCVKGFS